MIKNKIHLSRCKVCIALVGIVFVFINILWYVGSYSQYQEFESMLRAHSDKTDGTLLDNEGFCYSVKKPSYLLWREGNLAIGKSLEAVDEPAENGKTLYASHSSLIIWMKHFHKGIRELGVILVQDGVSRQIYLEDNRTARYKDDQPYVDAGQEEIDKLFRKAEQEWKLEMPWKE